MCDSGGGLRCQHALRNAWQTSSALIRSDIDQPTMRRLARSRIAARYNQPSPVLTKVMSLTQA
ncbi:hypothetical protein WM23_22415 [Burkholderia ubonensis]|nr:hypothetical protein WM23_22415 [Burkholderia ubonensis]